jgi:multidrug efflux pump subunit AcrB
VEIEKHGTQHGYGQQSHCKRRWILAGEVGLAVLARGAAIIAVFMPVAFMGGVPESVFQNRFGVDGCRFYDLLDLVERTVTR